MIHALQYHQLIIFHVNDLLYNFLLPILIHFKKYETFNGNQGINGATEPTNGMYRNIPEHSIVFI